MGVGCSGLKVLGVVGIREGKYGVGLGVGAGMIAGDPVVVA